MAARQVQWESRTRTLANGEVERWLERPVPGEPGVVERHYPQGSAIRESSAVGTAYVLRPGQRMPRPPRSAASRSTSSKRLTVFMTKNAGDELWETLRYVGDLEYAGGLYGRVGESSITIDHVFGACKDRRATSCSFDVNKILAHAEEFRGTNVQLLGNFHTEPGYGDWKPSRSDLKSWLSWTRQADTDAFVGVTVRKPVKGWLGWTGAEVRAHVFRRDQSGEVDIESVQVVEPKAYIL